MIKQDKVPGAGPGWAGRLEQGGSQEEVTPKLPLEGAAWAVWHQGTKYPNTSEFGGAKAQSGYGEGSKRWHWREE